MEKGKKGQMHVGLIMALAGVFITIISVTVFLPLIDNAIRTYYATNTSGTGQKLLYSFNPIFDILIVITPLGVLGYLSYAAFKKQ